MLRQIPNAYLTSALPPSRQSCQSLSNTISTEDDHGAAVEPSPRHSNNHPHYALYTDSLVLPPPPPGAPSVKIVPLSECSPPLRPPVALESARRRRTKQKRSSAHIHLLAVARSPATSPTRCSPLPPCRHRPIITNGVGGHCCHGQNHSWPDRPVSPHLLHALKIATQVVFIQVTLLNLFGHFSLAFPCLLGILKLETMLVHGESHCLQAVERKVSSQPTFSSADRPLYSKPDQGQGITLTLSSCNARQARIRSWNASPGSLVA